MSLYACLRYFRTHFFYGYLKELCFCVTLWHGRKHVLIFFLWLTTSTNWQCPQIFKFCWYEMAINRKSHLETKILIEPINFLHPAENISTNFSFSYGQNETPTLLKFFWNMLLSLHDQNHTQVFWFDIQHFWNFIIIIFLLTWHLYMLK